MKEPRSVIDLHCHSDHSDGVLAPQTVVQHAAERGIRVLALTDHDSTNGVAAAATAAISLDVSLVPGVEISVSWERTALHVVGLGIDPQADALRDGLIRQQTLRAERAHLIAEKLAKSGVPDVQNWLAQRDASSCTRMHFARYIVERGLAHAPGQAFKHYLGRGRPAHVSAQWTTLDTALSWIEQSGGIAVLAHPGRYDFSATKLRQVLETFRSAGGYGMEVNYSGCDKGQINQLCDLAKRFDLHASLGSDFHDPALPWTRFGQLPQLDDRIPAVWHHERLQPYVAGLLQ